MSHGNEMICQPVTLSGYAEWPKVADAVIEASRGIYRLVAGTDSRARLWGYLLCLGRDSRRMSQDARGSWGGDYQRPGAACRWAWPWPDAFTEPLCPRPGWQSAGMDDVPGMKGQA